MFKLICKTKYNQLMKIKSEHSAQGDLINNLNKHLKEERVFFKALIENIKENKATIYDIKVNKNNTDTYICIIDKRDKHFNGNLNMFVINPEIIPIETPANYNDMPFMETKFNDGMVILQELHSDVKSGNYENMGYGTMMIQSLIKLALEANCTSIEGKLSFVDAEVENKKIKRNHFYNKLGFTIVFDDDSQKSGSFCKQLSPSK